MNLNGNTILITGGGSGIGRGIAEAFHKRGNTVIIAGRRKRALADTLAANPGMKSVELDISNVDSVASVSQQLIQDYPALNVLFNNAGIMEIDDASSMIDESLLTRTMTTNLLGPIRLASALVDHLKKQKNSTILYNTSVLAFTPLAITAIYSATKAALHSYALSQRYKLRGASVRVLEIAPPWVQTDLMNSKEEQRAMPLAAFLEETIELLSTDAEEIVVGAAKPLRDNAGPAEHSFVTQFNDLMTGGPTKEPALSSAGELGALVQASFGDPSQY
jgi:uncharacterized oxidoreductase